MTGPIAWHRPHVQPGSRHACPMPFTFRSMQRSAKRRASVRGSLRPPHGRSGRLVDLAGPAIAVIGIPLLRFPGRRRRGGIHHGHENHRSPCSSCSPSVRRHSPRLGTRQQACRGSDAIIPSLSVSMALATRSPARPPSRASRMTSTDTTRSRTAGTCCRTFRAPTGATHTVACSMEKDTSALGSAAATWPTCGEYDPVSEQWTQLASLPASGRMHPAFVITDEGKLFVGMGNAGGNFRGLVGIRNRHQCLDAGRRICREAQGIIPSTSTLESTRTSASATGPSPTKISIASTPTTTPGPVCRTSRARPGSRAPSSRMTARGTS